jgi:hypothetical protein
VIDPANTLYVVIQVAVAIAGFAGIVSAVQEEHMRVLLTLRLFNLLSCSFAVLFVSGFALVLMHAEVEPDTIWRSTSVLIVFVSVAGAVLSLQRVGAVRAKMPDFGGLLTGVVINVTLVINLILLVWNAVEWAVFWPVLIGVGWPFGLACYSFTHLLFEGLEPQSGPK